MYNILICDDQPDIVNALKIYLAPEGYKLYEAYTGDEALEMVRSGDFHLVLLDIMMPQMDGITATAKIREFSNVPIILLTAKSETEDKVLGLNVGADDYVTKPFGTSELLARVRAALRHAAQRSAGHPAQTYVCGGLSVDWEKRRVILAGQDIHLTQNEYKIVALLAQHAGKVLTYDQIIQHVWGPNAAGDNRILRVNMANIRRKLEVNPAEPEYIFTEIGVGYRMAEGE